MNATLLARETRRARAVFIMNNDTWITMPVPLEIMRAGENTLEVNVRKLNPQMSEEPVLNGMEVLVEYDRGLSNNTG